MTEIPQRVNAIQEKQNHISTRSVKLAVSMAALLSLLLIASGIWNAINSAETAESNIKMIVKARQLSNSLQSNQDSMAISVEMAISSGDASWRKNFDNSHTKLLDVIQSTNELIDDPIMKNIQTTLSEVVALERKLFNHLASDNPSGAFEILVSDNYQNLKVQQERLAFTLRSILDKRAQNLANLLKDRLSKTIMVLSAQTILILAIWFLTVSVIRHWHKINNHHKEVLTRLAHHDTLTGIGNRSLFQERLKVAFDMADKEEKSVALFLMDLDHFKRINDTLGHEVGDKLLVRVAAELQNVCNADDTIVRLGGDEFAVVINNVDSPADTVIQAQKILQIFSTPLLIDKREISTGTSLGISFYPQNAQSGDDLLRKADLALYEAKRNGRGDIQFFNNEIETKARYKSELLDDLSHALANNELHLVYQPIIDLQSGLFKGVETLLRWTHPIRGNVSPVEFIPLAEESRLIVPIGKWVLKEACKQQVRWVKQGLTDIHIAVNLSAVQFEDKDMIRNINDIIAESHIQRECLTLEITESTIMESNNDVIQRLSELRSIGIYLAIDDFGTGYSSLAYLKRFPIQHLKVDRAFVNELPGNEQDVAITRSIIKMAHELGLQVVAEGIENKEQLEFLKESGCNYGQGFYFGAPMSEKKAFQLLQSNYHAHGQISRIA